MNAFWMLFGCFVAEAIYDSAPMWGLLAALQGWNIPNLDSYGYTPQSIGLMFLGAVITIIPVFAIIFSRKKALSITLSIINLILSLVVIFRLVDCAHVVLFQICWLIYFVAGILILLNALDVKAKKMFTVSFFVLGAISLAIFMGVAGLSGNLHSGSIMDYRWDRFNLWYALTKRSIWLDLGSYYACHSLSVLHPLSQVLSYFVFGTGMLCNWYKQEHVHQITYTNQEGISVMVHKNKLTAILLSVFVGTLGIDRFYLGYTGSGVAKLLTLGGFGIWTLVDLVMICTGSLRPADGSPWEEDVHREQFVAAQPVAATSTHKSEISSLETIERLAKLYEQGILTDEEFQQKKLDLLAKM